MSHFTLTIVPHGADFDHNIRVNNNLRVDNANKSMATDNDKWTLDWEAVQTTPLSDTLAQSV